MNVSTDPGDPVQRHLAIVSVVVTIAAAIFSIIEGARTLELALLVLAACAVAWLALSGYGRGRIAIGRLRPSWNVLAALLLLIMATLVLAAPWRAKQDIGVRSFPVDKNAPPPKLVESSAACIADLKRQYTCHAFREKVANSPSMFITNDPDKMTLDEPLELAIAIGQAKMLTADPAGDYCALFESSISEACNTLAGNPSSSRR
jgi:hypothetical protein